MLAVLTMKSLTYIAYTVCLVLFSITGCSRIRHQWTQQSENPPCHRCASVYSSTPAVNDVDLRELIRNGNTYRGQIIRVSGNLHNDAGYKTLFPAGTDGRTEYLLAEFTDLSSFAACDGVEQILHEVAGINNWFDGSARVVVVGRIGALDHFRRGRTGFEIMCAEGASTIDTKSP